VTAVDKSKSGIARLREVASAEGLALEAVLGDLAELGHRRGYDLVIAHGVLHLLPPPRADDAVQAMKAATRPGGWNVAAVFTDALPQPRDLEPFVLKPFSKGELFAFYSDWELGRADSYVLEDEHSGGIRHRHAIDRIVARRPLGRGGNVVQR
jgi:tellurite methyltransferase